MEFIQIQKTLYNDLAETYDTFGVLYEKKLWHELSIALDNFLLNRNNCRGSNFIELYDNFITKFESRLSQVKLATLISLICYGSENPSKSLEFLNKILLARTRLGPEASLCLDMDVVVIKLRLGTIDEAKQMLEDAKAVLPTISSTETAVLSRFYRATMEYRKVIGPPHEYYKAALMFLAYTSMDELPSDEKLILATDIAIASITGDDIYNFGQVLATPILTVLIGTSNEWMYQLVLILNRGDIDGFNMLVNNYREQYYKQQFLASRHEEIKKKMVLLSLLNIAFERPPHDRTISFNDIAVRTRIPIEQVEWVLMRAMSIGLLKGTIDGIDQTINVSWVQPRVLGKDDISTLSNQLAGWVDRVRDALSVVSDQTQELFA